jgi:hypothetical protein
MVSGRTKALSIVSLVAFIWFTFVAVDFGPQSPLTPSSRTPEASSRAVSPEPLSLSPAEVFTDPRPAAEDKITARTLYDVVLTCYYYTPQFYKTRAWAAPVWILAFLRSAYQFRLSRDGTPMRVMVFADPNTTAALRLQVQREEWVTAGVSEFLTFVEVSTETHGALLAQDWASEIRNGANNFRFQLYHDWLQLRQESVRFVVMSDVTDVAFQANPFDACNLHASSTEARPVVLFTLEHRKANFKREVYNRRWMQCFGSSVLGGLARARQPISCAGVTLANVAGALIYTHEQVQLIKTPKLVVCARDVVGAALDQATHNFLLSSWMGVTDGSEHQVRFSPGAVDVRFSETGGIQQSASYKPEMHCAFHGNYGAASVTVANGIALGEDRQPYGIVHQYTSNRVPALQAAIGKRYRIEES